MGLDEFFRQSMHLRNSEQRPREASVWILARDQRDFPTRPGCLFDKFFDMDNIGSGSV
jgi:hypothetical protein